MFRCEANVNMPGDCSAACPLTNATFRQCWAACDGDALCAGFVHNRYSQCFPKREPSTHGAESAAHGTISCVKTSRAERLHAAIRGFSRGGGAAAPLPPRRCATAAGGERLPVVVLNLNGSARRLAKVARELEREGVHRWTRHAAVPARAVDLRRLAREGVVDRAHPPAKGNVAVALSHMQVWARLAAGAYGARVDAALVLEDDATLKPGFRRLVRQLLEATCDLDWDVLMLTWYRHLTQPHCVHALPGRPEVVLLRCSSGLITGTNAYLITRRGAQRAREVLRPLRRTSKDLQLGIHSEKLNWFGATTPAAGHDWSARSERVYGLSTQ
ncbi:hypothetical protein AB1Y20_016231 [Prymnesium parvum]|uniref:Glycosyl transferase family 25 domain-containing protein n=1 Tax=Prymnesium parvum TaxID=97485 RepID=A0AB34IEN5_PRYPA